MYNDNYQAVGTVFKYYRPLAVNDTMSESITAKGPITSSIDIMVSHTLTDMLYWQQWDIHDFT